MHTLGLPEAIRACLFDLDGVLTETASIHFEAWKQTFDGFMRELGGDLDPFSKQDYLRYVDGRPRYDGVRSFLESRSIFLPESGVGPPPTGHTVRTLGDKKNVLVMELMQSMGVTPFEGSLRYLDAAEKAGLRMGVVSASANARAVLEAASLLERFDVIVDGVVASEQRLRGKPFPDTFAYAAGQLELDPSVVCVFEDALAGIKAAREGGFRYVVGVNRAGQAEQLVQEGANIVVDDLAELLESA